MPVLPSSRKRRTCRGSLISRAGQAGLCAVLRWWCVRVRLRASYRCRVCAARLHAAHIAFVSCVRIVWMVPVVRVVRVAQIVRIVRTFRIVRIPRIVRIVRAVRIVRILRIVRFYGLSGLFEYMPLAASRFRTSSASAPPTKPVSADAVPATGRYEKTAGVWRNTDASAI